MDKNVQHQVVLHKDTTSNPAPLGLLGFGMTTILLNLHNAGLFGLDSAIMAMGIFVGGLAQVVAGIMEWKKGNTFGKVAFTSYGFFWLSLVTIWLLPKTDLAVAAPTEVSMGFYLLLWGIFTLFMFFGTLRTNRVQQFVFASLAVLFFLLSIADFTGTSKVLAGVVGIFCGSSAMYLSMAEVLNEIYEKPVLPIFPVKR
ncbi:MAG TPA: acetate uptake transporter [Thermotogota bacterium]|nr:acetate uptake transporter [Thermotogota bacterium]HPJ88349.1 acetate uptake transporter [Thermotogota bacterium]HPR95483.1 acetate uptake transporter [Thermotogota bacterium]